MNTEMLIMNFIFGDKEYMYLGPWHVMYILFSASIKIIQEPAAFLLNSCIVETVLKAFGALC